FFFISFIAAAINEMKKNFGDISNNQLVNKFKDFKTYEDLPFYISNVETKRALGLVYLDKNVKDGVVYYYRIHKRSAPKRHFGWTLCKTGMGNYILPQLKAKWADADGTDSLIQLMWSLPLDKTQDSFAKTKQEEDTQFNNALHGLPFPYSSLSANVVTKSNEAWNFEERILPQFNEEKNALEFRWRKETTPKEITQAHIILVDEVYNEGSSSDTAIVIATDTSTVEYIYEINVQDTLNGIHISWDPLPNEAYYTGIEIKRYDSDDLLDSTIYLGPQETMYLDRNLILGNYYRYYVKALFVPQKGLVQKVGAQGVGTFSRFTKPLPPFNLEANTTDQFIELNWEHADEQTVFAYYVYRGTNPEDLELASGPIKTSSFTDTLEALSGRTHYFYAVASQNFQQDTSDYSNIVSIKPDKAIDLMEPSTVEVYFANDEAHLNWRDVRSGDNIIEGYVVQRKANNEEAYTTIHKGFINKATFVDTSISRGNTYSYRVASRSIYGDLSKFSSGTIVEIEKDKVATINTFFVRNVTEGINISLPKMTSPSRKAYNIYRKSASENNYNKIATIDATTFEYIDRKVQNDQLYIYYITLVETDDREGPKGKTKTIRVK
ncbi:MAG: hypothetical protein AAGK97_04880, partial [Bacteroidota bacterium]